MELRRVFLPAQFLEHLPEGIKLIRRKGETFLVIEQLFDADGNNLITESIRIHGEPSVRIKAKIGAADGLIFIDAFWGSHTKLYGFVPDISAAAGSGDPAMVEAFSPVTGGSLMADWNCTEKGCPSRRAILFRLPGEGNLIRVCARLGCPGHYIHIQELKERISEEVSNINYFGEGEDEIFEGI